MSASSIPSTAGDTLLDADPQFNVTALHADRETGQRAKEIHDRFLKVFAPELIPVFRVWRFDVLRDTLWHPNSINVYLQDAARRAELDFLSNAERIRL